MQWPLFNLTFASQIPTPFWCYSIRVSAHLEAIWKCSAGVFFDTYVSFVFILQNSGTFSSRKSRTGGPPSEQTYLQFSRGQVGFFFLNPCPVTELLQVHLFPSITRLLSRNPWINMTKLQYRLPNLPVLSEESSRYRSLQDFWRIEWTRNL